MKESIVDPNKVIAPGFAAGVMPGNFGESLSAEEIDALVAYLTEAAVTGRAVSRAKELIG